MNLKIEGMGTQQITDEPTPKFDPKFDHYKIFCEKHNLHWRPDIYKDCPLCVSDESKKDSDNIRMRWKKWKK